MASEVFMTDMSANWNRSVPAKLFDLFNALEPSAVIDSKDLIAIKIHFGEAGNTAHIRPQFVRKIVEAIRSIGARPFLTDTNTLYVGSRTEAWSHLNTAYDNGFTRDVTGAPILIADGLRGSNSIEVPLENSRHLKLAHVASDIQQADGLVVISHFKGHELSGFGGAIKNVGMGCASRSGKLDQHSNISPVVKQKKCIGCGECVHWCRGAAIELIQHEKTKKAKINSEKCIGCAECILTCRRGAISIQWNESIPVFMEKMVEYAKAVLKNKSGKALFLNFLTDVSPLCDCTPFSDRSIVPSIGILASKDMVAIDSASANLVNSAPGNAMSCLKSALEPGADKFRALFPDIDWNHQIEYAEQLGLGSRDFELKLIP